MNQVGVDKGFMKMALVEAATAFENGDFPVGCVIVCNRAVVAKGCRLGTDGDDGRFSEVDHAEIRALSALGRREAGAGALTLYCTMEPCLMCFAAAVLSGVDRVVYAYEDVMGGGTGCDMQQLPPLYRERRVAVVPGVMRRESLSLFCRFFSRPDNRYWRKSLLEAYTLSEGRRLGI